MRSHSSSVKSPCVDLQVFEMDPSAAPIYRVYANSDPESTELPTHTAPIFPTASEAFTMALLVG
jgi:hypothetical protein